MPSNEPLDEVSCPEKDPKTSGEELCAAAEVSTPANIQTKSAASGSERASIPTATPLGTGRKRGPVAKRRFQKGRFVIERSMAYSFYYEDVPQPDGSVASRKVRHFIGRVGEDGISERAARREHDPIMQDVNRRRGSVAPAYRGQSFAELTELWRRRLLRTCHPLPFVSASPTCKRTLLQGLENRPCSRWAYKSFNNSLPICESRCREKPS